VTRPADPGARLAAAGLQDTNPGWLVLWGRYDRCFFAFPRFRAPPGMIVTAPAPASLLTAMRAAEQEAAHPRPPAT
jgi:hypothetical protein